MSSQNAQNPGATPQRHSAADSSRQRDDSRARRTSSHDLDRTSRRHASSARPSSGQSKDNKRGFSDAEDQQAHLPETTGHPSNQAGQPSQSYGRVTPTQAALPGPPPSDSLPGPPARLPAPSPLPGPPPRPPPSATPVLQVRYVP